MTGCHPGGWQTPGHSSRREKGERRARQGLTVGPPSAGRRAAWRSWMCLPRTLLLASVPGGARQ